VLTAFLTSGSAQNISHNFPAYFHHQSMIAGLFNHYNRTKNETPISILDFCVACMTFLQDISKCGTWRWSVLQPKHVVKFETWIHKKIPVKDQLYVIPLNILHYVELPTSTPHNLIIIIIKFIIIIIYICVCVCVCVTELGHLLTRPGLTYP